MSHKRVQKEAEAVVHAREDRQGAARTQHTPWCLFRSPPPALHHPPEANARQAVEQLLLVGPQQLGQHAQQALHHGTVLGSHQPGGQRAQQARQQRCLRGGHGTRRE